MREPSLKRGEFGQRYVEDIKAPSDFEGVSVVSSAFAMKANSWQAEKRAQMETEEGAIICSCSRGLIPEGQDIQETVRGELTN